MARRVFTFRGALPCSLLNGLATFALLCAMKLSLPAADGRGHAAPDVYTPPPPNAA